MTCVVPVVLSWALKRSKRPCLGSVHRTDFRRNSMHFLHASFGGRRSPGRDETPENNTQTDTSGFDAGKAH